MKNDLAHASAAAGGRPCAGLVARVLSASRVGIGIALVLASLSGCDAATTLKGKWTIASWTYTVESTSADTSNVDEDSVDDAGSLEFFDTPGQNGFGEFSLARTFTQFPTRGSSDAAFTSAAFSDIVDWSPGGLDSEPDQVTIFDGNDTLWNGPWTFAGDTLSRSFFTDFGGEATLLETSTLRLAR